MGGTAIPDDDYRPLEDHVVISAGQTGYLIAVIPCHEDEVEGPVPPERKGE